MKFIADFHIHSKYSRATSQSMDLEHINLWAKIKGIDVIGTGDFTHPEWFQNLKEKLEPQGNGLYKLKNPAKVEDDLGNLASSINKETFFILTTEVSCIYSKNNKIRKIHILIFSPNLETCEKINTQLSWVGNLKSDGRPILGMDAKELTKIVLNASSDCFVVPAHAWTPWFSVFGSMSGFDSLEECFEEYTPQIFSIETGLSSDPEMNWRLSKLDKITLISNSDAHSPCKLGREANVFDCELSYQDIIKAIKEKDLKKFLYTIEFFPEEGKYHFDGHRNCQVCFSPAETKKNNYLCPKCKRPVTVGVMHRVEKLADRPEGFRPENSPDSHHLIPLEEIIADCYQTSPGTVGVTKEYQNLIRNLGQEFAILEDIPFEEIEKFTSPKILEAIKRVRQGKVKLQPGYDGQYGKISIFGEKEPESKEEQMKLL